MTKRIKYDKIRLEGLRKLTTERDAVKGAQRLSSFPLQFPSFFFGKERDMDISIYKNKIYNFEVAERGKGIKVAIKELEDKENGEKGHIFESQEDI